MPLKAIIDRQNLINLALDNVIADMRDAVGTQNTLSNRLTQSLNDDGSLRQSAVDNAMHTMDDHTDTDNYVRMTKAQSDKLNLVQDEANNLVLNVYTDDTNYVAFNTGEVNLQASSTIIASVEAPNNVKLNLAFSSDAIHSHNYGLTPVPTNIVTPDYTNYQVNSLSSTFIDGTLRVYINGVRIFSDGQVYVPGALATDQWTLMSFTPDSTNGLFELSSAITEEDMIRIDFDIALT